MRDVPAKENETGCRTSGRRCRKARPEVVEGRECSTQQSRRLRSFEGVTLKGSLNDPSVILDTAIAHCHHQNDVMTSTPGHADFDTLTRQHKDSVYRQMLRVCGNREDAEDVLVEALLKAYRHLNQLRDSAAFRAWLAQIARRICWQLKEREALLPLLQLSTLDEEGRDLPGTDPTPEASLARRQMKQLLDDAIATLPELYHSVYELRDIEDRPGDEVAQQLGISRAAMKSRLHRARDLVREHLDTVLTRSASPEPTND